MTNRFFKKLGMHCQITAAARLLLSLAMLSVSTGLSASATAQTSAPLKLNEGDRICLIGNALAERQQYFGYFESLLQKQFPELKLSVRNLGFCGDEVRFRPRSLDFGEPDQHLTLRKADVIFAFFGFNESFHGEDGLPVFRQEVEDFITHTLAQKYNGETAPRLVLFSPQPHEPMLSPHLPNAAESNARIARYRDVMKDVAAIHDVLFVDLFHDIMGDGLLQGGNRLTFNGIHFTKDGNRYLGELMMHKLFGVNVTWSDELEPLRTEVLEKNFNNFHDYRAVNGFYIYGGRSQRDHSNPPFTDAYVIENERAKLREMAAVCDERIWTVAAGGTVPKEVDYSGTRKLYDVPTNFKQPIEIKTPEEAMKQFVIADGYEVNLFASEIDFPELRNPVNFTFDTQGRLWVATMPTYPQYLPPEKPDDKLLIFEDTDHDGRADTMTVFADGLHLPTGFELGDGGVYVAQEPNLMFLQDTDGDGRADHRELILHGFDSGDSHHAIGAFIWGPGGGIYMHEGTFHITQVETPWGPVRNGHGAVYRFDPTRQKLETFVSYNFANPWGHCFDKWGQNFVADASGGANYFGTAFSGRPFPYTGQDDFGPFKFTYTKPLKQFFPKRVRPTSGCEIVSSRHFPPEAQGNYLLNNVIGFQGILQHTVREEGSGFVGQEIEPLLYSTDRNFRPTDLQFGPDGALYVVDWFNPLIGHMQHSLRDPNRDHIHGRIWRVTYPSRDLLKPPQIEGRSVAELLELLKSPEDRTRQQVRTRLREFPADAADRELRDMNNAIRGLDHVTIPEEQVVPAVQAWVAALDATDPGVEHHKLEALWVLQHHNAIALKNPELRSFALAHLNAVASSPEPRARAAATRVLSFWHSYLELDTALRLLRQQANDDHPRVRLEAVRAASHFDDARAAEAALDVLQYPTDDYIDYALEYTIRRLEEFWKPTVGSGQPFAESNPHAIEYIIASIATTDLINMVRSETVYHELLSRRGVVHQYRMEAMTGLAKLRGTSPAEELVAAVQRLDQSDTKESDQVLADLTHLFTMLQPAELTTAEEQLISLSASARKLITRKVATVARIVAADSVEPAWDAATTNPQRLLEFTETVPLIPSVEMRSSLYDRLADLTTSMPPSIEQQLGPSTGTQGRFVRVQLPGPRRTLTLAEVEIYSGDRNIAPYGKASQSGTAFGGEASRAIDGNVNGAYNDGGQTHTPGDQPDPWWEIDLGSTQSIDRIVIWNRTDGELGQRLDGFTLSVLSESREAVFEVRDQAAPQPTSTIAVNSDPRVAIRRSTLLALASIPDRDQDTFELLFPLIPNDQFRTAAIRSLAKLRHEQLPPEQLRHVITELIQFIEAVPPKDRTEGTAIDAIQLARDLSLRLPDAEAIETRSRLSELAVEVIVIRPIPHRMLFDRTDVYVQAGKPVEFVLENTDIMPHNLVITTPGAREEVGILAEKMGASAEGFARQFIPDSDKVLHATGMLQPDVREKLQITAPAEPGDYPFVCTFPGHWRTMYGTMHVVADLSEVPLEAMRQVADADGHAGSHDHGEAMKRSFIRKWSVDDLTAVEGRVYGGRSFEHGKQLFTAVSCVQCHKMNGEGGAVGPDLKIVREKLESKKLDFAGLATAMIHPSKDIEPQFRTLIILTVEGKLASGVVVENTDDSITLSANPLDKASKTTTILKEDIEELEESKVSIMPDGLLNTMTRDEILDLLAYLMSGGKPDAAPFEGQAASTSTQE